MAEPFYLLNEEVDVFEGRSRVRDHHPEKVDFVALWLVADHRGPVLHHPGLDHRSHLECPGNRRKKVIPDIEHNKRKALKLTL